MRSLRRKIERVAIKLLRLTVRCGLVFLHAIATFASDSREASSYHQARLSTENEAH